MRLIDADSFVTVMLYDDEHEEYYTDKCKCSKCIFSHEHPFIKPSRPIKSPRHCALHFCTVDAEDSCKDGIERSRR